MNFFNIVLGLFLLLLFYFAIHMLINRGKIEPKYLILILSYTLLVGIPVAYYNIFPEKLNLALYIIYYVVVLLPTFLYQAYYCLKKRQTWTQFILLSIGVIPILMSPFFDFPLRLWSIGIGWAFLAGFFTYLFRYPHLNPMWLDDVAKKAAANIEKDCKYSSKPVIVLVPSRKTSCTGTFGLFLLFKRNSAIVKMSDDFHKKLGRPNMEKYAEELVKRIKEKIKEEEKGDSE